MSILFIDDDILALQLMTRASGLLGFQAITSTSPRSALAMAKNEKPSLIMVDMQMNEMNGSEFVQAVRRSPDIAHLPVVICSAGFDDKDEEQARRAGVTGFLMKPVGLKELSQAIQTYARE